MTWQAHQLLAMANLAICLGIGWACICRLNSYVARQYKLARARYALLLAGAVASGLQPMLWNTWTTVGDTIFSACVLAGLLINVARWHGAGHPMRRQDDHEL